MTKVTENWFKTWFDTKYYHILYKHRDNEEANLFIGKLVVYLNLTKGMNVADICCGKGRHSLELSKYGLRVWGMDLSANSIESARSMSNELTSLMYMTCEIPSLKKISMQCLIFLRALVTLKMPLKM